MQAKSATDPRRGIHFQSAMGNSSKDEVSEKSDEDCTGVTEEARSCSNYWREEKPENKAMTKPPEKVHSAPNVAFKSCSSIHEIFVFPLINFIYVSFVIIQFLNIYAKSWTDVQNSGQCVFLCSETD